MRRETFFKNNGPMGAKHSQLRVFRTVYGNQIDITVISDPEGETSQNSFNVVLTGAQVKQLIRLLKDEKVELPPADIFQIGGDSHD